MVEDWLIEASKLIERASRLSRDERETLNYFLENLSVGDLRVLSELKARGVRDPIRVLIRLLEEGFIYKAADCYNLAKPLRLYIQRRGDLRV
ncbi:MAG: hypothetical protein GSR85_06555 [Desulfurococcales archaeon]|nr:hypothetical protein [Desulfurococcales archaeon]